MRQLLRFLNLKNKVIVKEKIKKLFLENELYTTKNLLISVGALFTPGIAIYAYRQYDAGFRKFIEEITSFSRSTFKSLPEFEDKVLQDNKIVADSSFQKTVCIPEESQFPLKIKSAEQSTTIEENELTENIEYIIKSLLIKLSEVSNDIDSTQIIVTRAIQGYSQKLYEALGNHGDPTHAWTSVEYAHDMQTLTLQYLKEKLDNLKTITDQLEVGKNIIKQNDEISKMLPLVESNINHARELAESVGKNIHNIEIESKNTPDYKTLIENAKQYFENEYKVSLSTDTSDCIENVIDNLISLVNKEINNLYKNAATKELAENSNTKYQDRDMLNSKSLIIAQSLINSEIVKEEFKKGIQNMTKTIEEDFHKQLQSQLSSHMNLLQESLQEQNDKLSLEYNEFMEEHLRKQRNIFYSENVARFRKIESYLETSNNILQKLRKAGELWLLCETVKNKLETYSLDKRVSVEKEIETLHQLTSINNEFVNTLLAGIPSEAFKEGIYTAHALKKKFKEVKHLCKKVALVDENHPNLYHYILSFFQSLFIVDVPVAELDNQSITDPMKWDTFEVLNYVGYYLNKNDLELALRCANLLKGEPRKVAEKWISDVRLFLELRQTINCLMLYSSAIAAQSYH